MAVLKTSSGRDGSTGPVWVALALVALVPSLSVLWFMTVAMRNERLAVQQRLTDVYLNHLVSARRQLTTFWKDKEAAIQSAANGAPAEVFAALVRSNLADSVIVQDAAGKVAYPGPAAVLAVGRVEEPADWLLARELEFQKSNYLAAAEAYGRVAREAADPNVQVKAIQSQAGCLLKAGQTQPAIGLLAQMTRDTGFQKAVGELGVAIMPNVQLLVLKLVNAPTNETFRTTCADLVRRLNDYGDALLSASQRRFLMEEVRTLVPEAAVFPTLAAEKLAADYLERSAALPRGAALQSAEVAGVWGFSTWHEPGRSVSTLQGAGAPEHAKAWTKNESSEHAKAWTTNARPRLLAGEQFEEEQGFAQGTVVALFREERLRAEMGSFLDALSLPDARVRLLAPGEAFFAPKALPPFEAGDRLPGWRLALTFQGPDPFDAASARQGRVYLRSGVFVVLVIALAALAAARYVGAQMRLARLKNDLVSTVTHELKTPLASMRALVDTLLAGRYHDAQQVETYLKLLAKETQRLSHLIDNFLAFSRMERGKQRFRFEELPPETVVSDAVEALKERLASSQCCFATRVEPDLPRIRGDADALSAVLINLLDNAWKYTDNEKRISVRAYADRRHVCFEVEDNGIGLDRREARRIFDRFYQVDQSLTRQRGGCGLGLSIVQSIVHAHDGAVEVQSEPGKGSTFRVKIPLAGSTALESKCAVH